MLQPAEVTVVPERPSMLQPAEVTVVPERPSMSTLPDPGAAAAGSCAWILDTLAIATCACNTDRTSGNMAVPIFTVCLFTVVGGMLCKSDKPSIIIIIINLYCDGMEG